MNNRLTALVAAAALAAVGAVGVSVAVPAKHLATEARSDGGCVVPDCRTTLGRGAWDSAHEPVDCLASSGPGPTGAQLPARWAGCNVMRAEKATGSACIPVACDVPAGEDPTRYGD